MGLRITTWNVDHSNPFSYEPWRGTRTFEAMFRILESDIVVFQETKIQRKDLRDDMVLVPGWDCYFSLPRVKKGYSGVVIYTRNETCAPIRAEEGILGTLCPPNSTIPYRDLPEDRQIGGYPTFDQLRVPATVDSEDQDGESDLGKAPEEPIDPAVLDSEGRCVVLEFQAFVLIGVYCPANRDESRDMFRLSFLNALDARVRNLVAMGKRVFVTGDINIAKQAIDSAHALEAIRKNTATEDEYVSTQSRRLFNQLLDDGKVIGFRDESRGQPVMHDICRSFHPDRIGMYTCWDTRLNTRPGNFGARIDYVLCTLDMKDWFAESNIQEGLMGSDHCPVYAVFKEKVPFKGDLVHTLDLMNPPGVFKNGVRQREYTSQWMLPESGRLLPEFNVDKRQNIKDMFARKPTPALHRASSSATTTSKSLPPDTATPAIQTPAVVQTVSVPASPGQKRTSDISSRKRSQPLLTAPIKRSRSSANQASLSTVTGQKTLKGFFKAKSMGEKNGKTPSETTTEDKSQTPFDGASSPRKQNGPFEINIGGSRNAETPTEPQSSQVSISSAQSSPQKSQTGTFIDPIVNKEDWGKLFAKKPAPRCDSHQEPCITLTTKKPGMNCGRAFWICPRPLGPSGEKEKGTQWRCPTFIWASDWNSSLQAD
ncbi:AP endonuclease 1 [Penicillium ucsense]|uniref:DNA-(apurinic or apyrimidinic site) endonuclease 2 n=1 Tax=Penicillium ucsense TaxID=2839758 RepID=A0A8J8WI58_9EURO|nr:AP endonuclease 1 [Penicillium ucsense]KAF7738838.1 AP endonuclease 1 [Penicillium ucsense]